MSRIRPTALTLFCRQNHLLVFPLHDEQHGYRIPGGGIDFGEQSKKAAIREIREELNAEMRNIYLLDVIENIFTYMGQVGHEVVFLYAGTFVDKSLYEQTEIIGDDNGIPFTAIWKPIHFFEREDAPPLFPTGVLELAKKL